MFHNTETDMVQYFYTEIFMAKSIDGKLYFEF